MAYERVASLEDLWEGEMLGVRASGRRVLLIHLGGAVHAYEDRCAHQQLPLSDGRLAGDRLVCSAHEWTYDACTGAGVNPRCASLRAFPVRVEGSDILVDVDGEPHR